MKFSGEGWCLPLHGWIAGAMGVIQGKGMRYFEGNSLTLLSWTIGKSSDCPQIFPFFVCCKYDFYQTMDILKHKPSVNWLLFNCSVTCTVKSGARGENVIRHSSSHFLILFLHFRMGKILTCFLTLLIDMLGNTEFQIRHSWGNSQLSFILWTD